MDDSTFARELDRVRGRAVRQVMRLTWNEADAEDVVQDAMLRAWANRARYREEGAFFTWFYTIVSRAQVDQIRARRAGVSLDVCVGVPDARQSPFDAAASAMELRRLQRAIGRIRSPLHRAAIVLAADGLTHREIADRIGVKEVTVRTQLFRARACIKAAVDG